MSLAVIQNRSVWNIDFIFKCTCLYDKIINTKIVTFFDSNRSMTTVTVFSRFTRRMIGLVFVMIFLSMLFLLIPSDVVTSRYSSLEEARTDRLFTRGWLPNILPESSKNIRTSNNLDINISEGEFEFMPQEWLGFSEKLEPYSSISNPFSDFEEYISRMIEKGFIIRIYENEGTAWVFFCKSEKGYCEYKMWLKS